MFGWDFRPLAAPCPFDPPVINDPARGASNQRRNIPIAITAILAFKFNDVDGTSFLIVPSPFEQGAGSSVVSRASSRPGARTLSAPIEYVSCKRGEARCPEVSLTRIHGFPAGLC